jgi:hypothetical protein
MPPRPCPHPHAHKRRTKIKTWFQILGVLEACADPVGCLLEPPAGSPAAHDQVTGWFFFFIIFSVQGTVV